jgi:hypothetical protein
MIVSAYTIFFVLVVSVLLGLLVWALRHSSRRTPDLPALGSLEELGPVHSQHFPAIQQALAASDREYLARRASARLRRRVRAERRRIARQFLAGLREDFARLNRLAAIVARLSPRLERGSEWRRFRLLARFQFFYALVWLDLALGGSAIRDLVQLTRLIGATSSRLEAAIYELGRLSILPGPSES